MRVFVFFPAMQVFALKPCEAYAKYTTDEFVGKFMPLLKSDTDRVPMYLHHVAILVMTYILASCVFLTTNAAQILQARSLN